jgi:hypothetical protein
MSPRAPVNFLKSPLPIILFVIILLFAFSPFSLSFSQALAATYYVDTTNGNDGNNGLSEATPWKTIAKVNTSKFNPEVRRLENKPSPFLDCKMHSMNQHFQSSIL